MSNQIAIKKNTVDIVASKVREFQNNGELFFPANYRPENALKSAWLKLQEATDRNGKPVLEVCTQSSIANSLLSMVVQGLNPDKNQCYFIAYGNKLQLQRSYFGSMAVAKSVNDNIEDIYGEVVYDGDEFEYSKKRGKTVVTRHVQKLQNVKKDRIIASYATVLYKDGREESTIMTLEEIKQAWKQSKMNPVDEKGNIKSGSTHEKFTADMCKKTVINKACKPIINSSDDSSIMAFYAKKSYSDAAEANVETEIAENANKDIIDIRTGEIISEHEPEIEFQADPEQIFASTEEGPGF